MVGGGGGDGERRVGGGGCSGLLGVVLGCRSWGLGGGVLLWGVFGMRGWALVRARWGEECGRRAGGI